MCTPMRNCPPLSPVDADKEETEAEIIHGVKVTLRQLKWMRRAIRSGQLVVSPERRKGINAAIELIEEFLMKKG